MVDKLHDKDSILTFQLGRIGIQLTSANSADCVSRKEYWNHDIRIEVLTY
jgi:hypothetical protein